MALCSFARHRLIPSGSNDPRIIPIGAILHVDAGNAPTLYHYFSGPSGGIESHFHIQRDGDVEQYRDTSREADANYQGNSFTRDGRGLGFVSIETQGYEYDHWTSAQLASIKRLLTWLSDTHDFPLRKCPAWDQSGVGYHVMFGAPGPWTPVAKTCPGPNRIKQFNNELVPWMETGGGEDDMTPEQAEQLERVYRAVTDEMSSPISGTPRTVRQIASDTLLHVVRLRSDVAPLRSALLAHIADGANLNADQLVADVEEAARRGTLEALEAEASVFAAAVLEQIGDEIEVSEDAIVSAIERVLRVGVGGAVDDPGDE